MTKRKERERDDRKEEDRGWERNAEGLSLGKANIQERRIGKFDRPIGRERSEGRWDEVEDMQEPDQEEGRACN